MSFGITNVFLPGVSPQPTLVLGQTVLMIDIDPFLPSASNYLTPFLISSMRSAASNFGAGTPFTQAIGEVLAQGAVSVVAIAIGQESDLQNILSYIQDIEFDVLLIPSLTANSSRLTILGNFAYSREQLGMPIIVVMQVDASVGWANLLDQPVGILAPFILQQGAAPMPSSRYFVLTPDSVTINPNIPSQYTAPAANSVAGLLTRQYPWQSITNQTLRGVEYDPSASCPVASAGAAAGTGYLVLRNSVRSGLVPYAGVSATSINTSSPIYSQYLHNLATLRCCQYVVNYIRLQTFSFVGNPSNGQIARTINGALGDLQTAGTILAFSSNTIVQQAQGTVIATISILPQFETQMITVYTQVNIQAG